MVTTCRAAYRQEKTLRTTDNSTTCASIASASVSLTIRTGTLARSASLAARKQRFFRSATYLSSPHDFAQIPGQPVAYWVSPSIRNAFSKCPPMNSVADARQGLATSDNGRFLRFWFEVQLSRIKFG